MKPINEIIRFEIGYFFAHNRIFTPFRYLIWKKKIYKMSQKTIEKFHRQFSKELCRDMMWKYCEHMISMPEYFLFDCEHRTYCEIEEFIGKREHKYWVWKMNDTSKYFIFKNKYETYSRFRDYYKRDVIEIIDESDFPKFYRFLYSNRRIIIKPISASFGRGVYIVDAEDERKAKALFNYLFMRFREGFVAEEIVHQCSEMAEFHPQSVNTVRMMTICHKDYVRIWNPFLRMGRGENYVDNANYGGIECIINPQTGVMEDASDFEGNTYENHPDTGKQLRGTQIPRWDEAISLAVELAKLIPKIRYVGWDLALTNEGWVVIEGNHAAEMGYQNIQKNSIKKEFKNELLKLKHNQ